MYNSSSFRLAQNALFVIEVDGTRHIENYAILPFDDDFDFASNNNWAKVGNPVLRAGIDPSGIGRAVAIRFDGTSKAQVPRIDYRQSNYYR